MHIANNVYSRSNSNSRENHPPSSSLRGKSGFTGMFDLARPIEPSLVAVRLKFTSLNRGRLSPVYAVYVDGRPVGFTPYGCVSALVLDEGLHSVCVGIDRWISDVVAPVPDGPADSGVHRHGRRMSCHFCLAAAQAVRFTLCHRSSERPCDRLPSSNTDVVCVMAAKAEACKQIRI
jgi:hypothetical protein